MTVHTDASTAQLLSRLGLAEENAGAFDGAWIQTHGERLESLNPATGEPIAAVRYASAEDYERVAAVLARGLPTNGAPGRRRSAARSCASSARRCAEHKEDLGLLVTLEVGKIRSRGPGRSAGDDRHGRLRRRPVAPALRPLDALRAAQSPDVRAVASARPGRRHHRLQLPGRGLGLERHARPRSAATR